ncbi:MAG TPA: thioredoxin family protein [Ignavibacteriaceae bacterium]|jgi:small redox-active disulfide protein 2|nr:thioredoxin family protein [Ignavibacteriaceae bacterium]
MNIKVLGPGCMNCQTLEKRTKEAVKNLNIQAEIEKVTDMKQITSFGIMLTPGLIVDGKIEMQGKVPAVEQIQDILKKHQSN